MTNSVALYGPDTITGGPSGGTNIGPNTVRSGPPDGPSIVSGPPV